MENLSERTTANMDSVLEETCNGFPNGGDHELRRHIAEKLKESAEQGRSTLAELRAVAQAALREAVKRMHRAPST
jgi:hypothetical protein